MSPWDCHVRYSSVFMGLSCLIHVVVSPWDCHVRDSGSFMGLSY